MMEKEDSWCWPCQSKLVKRAVLREGMRIGRRPVAPILQQAVALSPSAIVPQPVGLLPALQSLGRNEVTTPNLPLQKECATLLDNHRLTCERCLASPLPIA